MPMPIHMTVTGARQGAIDGPCTMRGREKTTLIQAFNHEVFMPRSPQTGLSMGKRVHNPLIVLKEIDNATPKLYMALQTGEELTVNLDWYRVDPNGGGKEQKYFTTKLDRAILVSIKPYIPNILDPANKNMGHMEELSYTYRKITWTYVPEGVETVDEWDVPA